jgi:glycosyltransferase involved in cell wall biosynthesis
MFLKAARSVLGQELKELELIVVDDGSTDGTADQIRQLMAEDERVSCLRHPRNVGLPAISEYEAYRKARAEHIAFAFDDDEFHPRALGALLREAVERDLAVVHGYVDIYVSGEGKGKAQKVGDFGRGRMAQALLRSHNYIANNSVLLHRRVLETVGLYDPHVCLARLCDWDLLRRIADHYAVNAVEVAVGKVWGPSTGDSLGHTYLTEPWLSAEWMNRDRRESLLPSRFEDYDVLALPEDLSGEARRALGELVRQFRSKFWFPAEREGDPTQPDGHVLVVTAAVDGRTTLYFDRLPPPWGSRVRIAQDAAWAAGLLEEMVGASAVVFIGALSRFEPWIERARRVGVPHYYFTDEDPLRPPSDDSDGADYTAEAVREQLRSFSGVLLSTRSLVEALAARRLHPNLLYFPPVAQTPVGRDGNGIAPEPGCVRIGYVSRPEADSAFRAHVHPAIAQVATQVPVELIALGMEPGSLDRDGGTPVTYVQRGEAHELGLWHLRAHDVGILVQPTDPAARSAFQVPQALIDAAAVGAAPVLSEGPPYDVLAGPEVALLCGEDPASWAEAIGRLARDAPMRERLTSTARAYCQEHFSGRDNETALGAILREHPSPGPLLRDVRFRKALAIAKKGLNPFVPGMAPTLVPVPVQGWMRYHLTPSRRLLSELSTLIGTMGGTLNGEMELQIIEASTGDALRRSSVPIRNLADWFEASFLFDPLDAAGRMLIAKFVPVTDGRAALFERSAHARTLHRRILRKLGHDHWGRDLHCRLH